MTKKKKVKEYTRPKTLVFTMDCVAVICSSPNEQYVMEDQIDGDQSFN